MNVMMHSQRIVEAGRLSAGVIQDIAEGALAAVRVPNFYPADLCDLMSERLLSDQSLGRYANAPDIGRMGMAFYEVIHNSSRQKRYFDDALDMIEQMRRIAHPYISPFDLFRLSLDEAWPCGASLGSILERRAFAGISRVFLPPAGGMPHQDILRRDAPADPEATAMAGQLAMNVYLKDADEGGEIELWDWIPTDEEHEKLRHSDPRYAYGLDPSRIRAADHVIRPNKGDLILFQPWNVHAIRPIVAGARVTWGCFIGYFGADRPLNYWS